MTAPTAVPQVPGATGMYPAPPAVAVIRATQVSADGFWESSAREEGADRDLVDGRLLRSVIDKMAEYSRC